MFYDRVKLASRGAAPHVVQSRAVEHLTLLLRDEAWNAYLSLKAGLVECRPENTLECFRIPGQAIVIVAPVTWEDWKQAFSSVCAPPNRLALFAHQFIECTEGTQSVDSYATTIMGAYTRFHDEAKRLPPAGTGPRGHANMHLLIALFDERLRPEIALHRGREASAPSMKVAIARGKKHEKSCLGNISLAPPAPTAAPDPQFASVSSLNTTSLPPDPGIHSPNATAGGISHCGTGGRQSYHRGVGVGPSRTTKATARFSTRGDQRVLRCGPPSEADRSPRPSIATDKSSKDRDAVSHCSHPPARRCTPRNLPVYWP